MTAMLYRLTKVLADVSHKNPELKFLNLIITLMIILYFRNNG